MADEAGAMTAISKQQLVENTQDLLSMPEVYLQVRDLLYDPKSSISDFSKVVACDPALTAKILKISNSAFFGFATEIDDLTRAINIMGTAQLHDLVLASSAMKSFNAIPLDIDNVEMFWRKSLYSGVFAQLIGGHCNSLDSERFFVVGLLHNIGHLILCSQLPEQMTEAYKKANSEHKPLFQVERETFGFDYADLGADLMREWQLPNSFVETTLCHLDPERAHNFPLETAVIHIANIMSINKHHETDNRLVISPQSMNYTNLDDEQLNILSQQAEIHFQESINLFLH